jgi:predicted kinase
MEVVLFIGLQGAGKSTFYQTHFAATHVLVSKDRFRNNRRPQRRQMHLIDEALRARHSVVVDNTNPAVADRAPIIALARAQEAKVIGVYFDAPLAACLERNAGRSGKARVPDAALHRTAKRMQPPTVAEGFDQLQRVTLAPDGTCRIGAYPPEGAR